jgi:hypothetical protein
LASAETINRDPVSFREAPNPDETFCKFPTYLTVLEDCNFQFLVRRRQAFIQLGGVVLTTLPTFSAAPTFT